MELCRERRPTTHWFAPFASAFAVFAVLVTASVGNAQEPLWGDDLAEKIDSLAQATLVDGLVSGLSIGVMRGEDVLLTQGYGLADLDNRVPAGPNTVYQIASITKQFTAAAILQLVDRGAVALDDPITKFLPDYPTQGHTVTIRHLLSHTSGVRSYPSDDTPLELLRLHISDEELLSRIQGEPFDFAPGESFRYSNAGFVLLGMIVTAASGQSYGDYLQDHVFGPLGMDRSSVCDHSRVTPGRARGYGLEGIELKVVDHDISIAHMAGAGALCSTVSDLLAWRSALAAGEVVTEAGYKAMVTPVQLSDGSELPYGLGVQVRERLEGRLTVFHGGGGPGFSSRLDYYPDADLTIAVMSNTYGPHVGNITDAIARLGLGIPMPAILDEPLSADQMDTYVGTYRTTTPEEQWRIFREGDWLFLAVNDRVPQRLKFQGNHVFTPQLSLFSRVTFKVDGGRASGFGLHECTVMNQSRCRTREGVREP